MENRRLTVKQKRLRINKRIWAAQEIIKRYPNTKELISDELIDECISILKLEKTVYGQKKAARTILNIKYGQEKANDIIEGFAIVIDRNDSLVRRWRNKVIGRDQHCQDCGAKHGLHAHHVISWAEDPVNRIKADNGITLCKHCHSSYHPELANLILSRGDG